MIFICKLQMNIIYDEDKQSWKLERLIQFLPLSLIDINNIFIDPFILYSNENDILSIPHCLGLFY